MTRKAMNFLAQQLRDQGLLPRSMREVKAELRNSGAILPPYDQSAAEKKPKRKRVQKTFVGASAGTSTHSIFRGYDLEEVNGCWIISKAGKELHRAGSQNDAWAWINQTKSAEFEQKADRLLGPDTSEEKSDTSAQVSADLAEAEKSPLAITPIEYGGLQAAYDHFNKELFGGELPDVFITYQRRAHSRGFFGANRFSERAGKSGRHELALNPDHFFDRTDEQICSTLVHEQCHVWQHARGTAPKRGYHNKEWAAKMQSLGLQPSTTGAPGGKQTGANVSHYIISDGPFQISFQKLAATGWKLNLQSAHQPGAKGGKNSKTKFTCPQCGQNAWGKPDLAVLCKPCLIEMKSTDTEVAAAA
jgi:predicted SprT family Zn-dependent metalloprotease